ncbi:MAG: T9SS type A sorting domain-containing protein [Bacteroidota bacterium]
MNEGELILMNHPNPFSDITIIEVQGFDDFQNSHLLVENTTGQIIQSFEINQKDSKFELNGTKLVSGIYYYSIINKNQTRVKTNIMSVIK